MLEWFPNFHSPQALLLAPVALAGIWWNTRSKQRATALFSSLEDLRDLPVTLAQRIYRLMPLLRATALLLLIIALARPQQGLTETRIRTEGIAIEAALDVSGSMDAMDFTLNSKQVTRLAAVKHVFSEFVGGGSDLNGRPDDLIGLVAFGGFADSRCPLTLDHGALLEVVKSLSTPKEIVDRSGNVLNKDLLQEERATAMGDAIALSLERLKEVKAKSKIIVLLSDGVNNLGIDPIQAAEIAKGMGVKVYTIGIGGNGEAPFMMRDIYGRMQMHAQYVQLDEDLLQELAKITGGTYFHAKNTDALRQVYAEIDKLERTETERFVYTEYLEWFWIPLAAGMVLMILDGVLSATRFRTLPA